MNEHCDSGQFIYDSIGHVPVYSIDSLPDLDDSQSLKENQKKYKRKKKKQKKSRRAHIWSAAKRLPQR